MINNSVSVSRSVSDHRSFPIYTITPHVVPVTDNKPVSVINPNHTHAHTRNNHTRNNHRNRYSLGYLIVCMVMSCVLGLIAMQNYIITRQEITATDSGYVSTIFGEDYLYE